MSTPMRLNGSGRIGAARGAGTVFVTLDMAVPTAIWGVEVDWRDMKKLCPPSSTLSTFLAHMLSFIRNLGEEHAQFLEDQGTPGAFISTPVATKSMWDMVQDFHPKTLACCFIVVGKGSDLGKAYDDLNLDIIGISEQGFAHWCTLCTLGESDQQCARCAHGSFLVPGTCFTRCEACIQSKDTELWGYE